jgi:hypothetical protein
MLAKIPVDVLARCHDVPFSRRWGCLKSVLGAARKLRLDWIAVIGEAQFASDLDKHEYLQISRESREIIYILSLPFFGVVKRLPLFSS